jgi:hypothetical protein
VAAGHAGSSPNTRAAITRPSSRWPSASPRCWVWR